MRRTEGDTEKRIYGIREEEMVKCIVRMIKVMTMRFEIKKKVKYL